MTDRNGGGRIGTTTFTSVMINGEMVCNGELNVGSKGGLFISYCVCSVTQPCPTLCDPTDWGPPASSAGILQARMLKCAVMPSSRGSSCQGLNLISWVSCFTGGFFLLGHQGVVCYYVGLSFCPAVAMMRTVELGGFRMQMLVAGTVRGALKKMNREWDAREKWGEMVSNITCDF